MAFDYPTISFGSNSFSVYADLHAADNYLVATITEAGTTWADAATTDLIKSKALVSATRWLDAALWLGAQTDAVTPQDLQWPRTNIPDVATDVLPTALIDAAIELAAMLVVDPDLRANLATPAAKEQHAGSAGITYFRPANVQVVSFFPTAVNKLVAKWLGGVAVTGAIANDVCEKSRLVPPFDFEHGI